MKNNENRAAEIVKYNGKMCRVLRIWAGEYYDLETVQKTEKGITEQYLSVEFNEIRAQADVKLKHSGLPICSVRQRALSWWETLSHYKQNWLAQQYCTQDAISFRYEQDKIEYIYKLVHGLD